MADPELASREFLVAEARLPFRLQRLAIASRAPLLAGSVALPAIADNEPLEYLSKPKGEETYCFPNTMEAAQFVPLLDQAHAFMTEADLDWQARHADIVLRASRVGAGQHQKRAVGSWHIDAVPLGEPSFYGFIAADAVPTEIAAQAGHLSTLEEISQLANQIDPAAVSSLEAGTAYFFNSYCIHRAAEAAVPTDRVSVLLAYMGGEERRLALPAQAVRVTYNPQTRLLTDRRTAAERELVTLGRELGATTAICMLPVAEGGQRLGTIDLTSHTPARRFQPADIARVERSSPLIARDLQSRSASDMAL